MKVVRTSKETFSGIAIMEYSGKDAATFCYVIFGISVQQFKEVEPSIKSD